MTFSVSSLTALMLVLFLSSTAVEVKQLLRTHTRTHTVELSNAYSLTWSSKRTIVLDLIPVYMHGSFELLTKVCPTLWTVWENIEDILLPLTFSVGDHCSCKYNRIHCADVLKFLKWRFCRRMLQLWNQVFMRAEQQSAVTGSNGWS